MKTSFGATTQAILQLQLKKGINITNVEEWLRYCWTYKFRLAKKINRDTEEIQKKTKYSFTENLNYQGGYFVNLKENLTKLCCGNYEDSDQNIILVNMSKRISNYSERIESFLNILGEDDMSSPISPQIEEASFYLPFLGRALLEVSLMSILFRIDPFKFHVLHKIQSHSTFAAEKRTLSSIEWSRDIIQEKWAHTNTNIWVQDSNLKKEENRALLGQYKYYVYWEKAFRTYIDTLEEGDVNFFDEINDESDIFSFFSANLRIIKENFSLFSKSIHGEVLTTSGNCIDSTTLSYKIQLTIKAISSLAFISHYIPEARFNLEKDDRCDVFSEIKGGLI